MALSTRSKKNLIEKVHEEMEEHYPMYDRETMEQAARTYLDCMDKEGFVFDFDRAWQWAGYGKKGDAKDKLTGRRGKLNLQEGVDYKIELASATAEIKNSSDQLASATAEATFKGVKHGGQNQEKIMLTARCLNQFALAAHTPQGQCLRDVVLAIIRLMKQFMNEVQSGQVRIVRTASADTRNVKRIKVCDTNKALAEEISKKNPSFGGLYGQIHGVTNKATTGRYKYETARMLGKDPKQVNARDYMTPAQLVFAEAIEILSAQKIRESDDNPLAVHIDVAEKVMANIKKDVQGPIADEPLKLRKARKMDAIQDIEKKDEEKQENVIQHVNTINNYFFKAY